MVSGYQNESSVVLHFIDGLYGNGGPQEFDYVVRLSDGHIMRQQEMVLISDNRLEAIMNRYVTGDFSANLSEGYHLSPVSLDSCKIIWPIGSHFNGEVIIPISELEPFFTEEGKALFKAKPVGAVAQKPAQDEEVAEVGGEELNTDISYGRGDLGIFDLRGPVKRCLKDNQSLMFSEDGLWLSRDGEPLAEIYPGGIIRDENGRLTKGMFDKSDETGHDYTVDNTGLVLAINYRDWMDAGSNVYYIYDDNGYVKKETIQEWGLDADEEAKVFEYTILELDKYKNWIRRQDQNGRIETRQITYYESEPGDGTHETVKIQKNEPSVQPPVQKVIEKKEVQNDVEKVKNNKSKQTPKTTKVRTNTQRVQPSAPENTVKPAPSKPGENTVNLNQLINYTNKKK